jgi:hypothetical protein
MRLQGSTLCTILPAIGLALSLAYANARCKAERPKLKSIGGIQIACHGIEEGRFDATIEMTAQTVSG